MSAPEPTYAQLEALRAELVEAMTPEIGPRMARIAVRGLPPDFPVSPSPETLVAAGLYPTGLYPNRHGGHYRMGPRELYPCCGGRGWYCVEDGERYCDGSIVGRSGCRAGAEKRRVD